MGFFFLATASRLALGHIQPPIQWVTGELSPGIKRPGHEAGHSLPTSTEVKNGWSYTTTTPIRPHGVVLNYHRNNFTLSTRGNVLAA